MKNKKLFAVAAILLSGILWGCMGLFVRTLTSYGFDSMQIAFLRVTSSAIMLPIVQAIFSPAFLKVRLRDLGWFAAIGFCSLLLLSFTYFRAIQMTSMSVAAILLYTAPIIVMVASILIFHEKVTKEKLIALVLAFAGCVLVSGIGSDTKASFLGILFGLAAGASYASYSILGTFVLRRYHSMTLTTYAFLFAALGSLFFCRPVETVQTIAQSENVLPLILLIFGLGLVTAVLPYSLYTIGLKHIEASKASILASVEPMVATILGFLVYREALSWMAICGIVSILLAILLLNRTAFSRKKES